MTNIYQYQVYKYLFSSLAGFLNSHILAFLTIAPCALYLALPLPVAAPLLLSRFGFRFASLPTPRAAFAYSSHRGGVRPGGGFLSSPSFGVLPGNFTEPPSSRTTPPRADIQSRTAKDTRPLAIFVAGRRTLEALPPAMWFRATSKKTIRPSDQSNSIT